MTEISSLLASLNKERAVLKDLLSIVDKETSGVDAGIDSGSNIAKHFETRIKDKNKVEEDKMKKIAALEGEIAEIENKKRQLESTMTEKNSNSEQLNARLTELQRTLDTGKSQVKDTTNELVDNEKTASDKKRLADKLKSDLQSLKKRHESDMQSLKRAHEEALSKFSRVDAQHKAVRLLIKEKAVTYPELKVIDVLRDQNVTTTDHLQRITQSRRDEIESTVKSLTRRGVLQIDSATGEIKVLRKLEI